VVPVVYSSYSLFAYRSLTLAQTGVATGYVLAAVLTTALGNWHSGLWAAAQRTPVFERLREVGHVFRDTDDFVGVGYSRDPIEVNDNDCWDQGALEFKDCKVIFFGVKSSFMLRPQDIVGSEIRRYPVKDGEGEQLFVEWQDESGRIGTFRLESQDDPTKGRALARMAKWQTFLSKSKAAPACEDAPNFPPHEADLPLELSLTTPRPLALGVATSFGVAVVVSAVVCWLIAVPGLGNLLTIIGGYVAYWYFALGPNSWNAINADFEARGMSLEQGRGHAEVQKVRSPDRDVPSEHIEQQHDVDEHLRHDR
jgi:hypothetical protein